MENETKKTLEAFARVTPFSPEILEKAFKDIEKATPPTGALRLVKRFAWSPVALDFGGGLCFLRYYYQLEERTGGKWDLTNVKIRR